MFIRAVCIPTGKQQLTGKDVISTLIPDYYSILCNCFYWYYTLYIQKLSTI